LTEYIQVWYAESRWKPELGNSIQFMNLVELNCQKILRVYELNWIEFRYFTKIFELIWIELDNAYELNWIELTEIFPDHWIELNWIGLNFRDYWIELSWVGNVFEVQWIESNSTQENFGKCSYKINLYDKTNEQPGSGFDLFCNYFPDLWNLGNSIQFNSWT
jgi:hypothetical protein